LGYAFNLKFDVRTHSKIDANHADTSQVAIDARDRVLRTLHEIDARFDADCSGRDDVYIFRDQRPLLCVSCTAKAEQRGKND
jgi:hypothetical protein